MGLIQKFAAFVGYERRDVQSFDPSWAAVSSGIYTSGLSVRGAENLSSVIACVNSIARSLAAIPVVVYQRTATGDRIEQPLHPMAQIVRRGANSGMTWCDWLEHVLASTLLHGNGISLIQRNGSGILEGFKYVPWGTVSVERLSSGKLRYTITDPITGQGGIFLEGEVLHLRDRTDDGYIGRPVLSRAAEAVSSVHDASSFARSLLRNGAYPSGILSAPGAISNETAARLKQTIADGFTGPRKAGQVFIAGDGLKWSTMQISPEDAELLESRKFGVVEIARIFDVPPPIIQDYENNTFTNAEQAGLWFATRTLSYWANKAEAEFSRSVFSGGNIEMSLDLSGLLRGDPQTRWANNKIALDTGAKTINEVRQEEGYNPIATGGTRRR
ncbi:MAG: phage portal protein [Pseudomonadota bacterium]